MTDAAKKPPVPNQNVLASTMPSTLAGNSATGLELSDDEKAALERLSGIDKAAILMLSLSEEDAAQIFRNLQPKQVQKLGIRMAELTDFSLDTVNAVHKTFLTAITRHSNIGLGSSDFVKKGCNHYSKRAPTNSNYCALIFRSRAKCADFKSIPRVIPP